MRRITTVLASAIGLAFMSQAALAAGMPVKAGPPPPPPFSWTGCYFGAFIGYKSAGINERDLFGFPTTSYDAIDGAAVGGEVGCQYQTGIWVFGVAGDWAWTSLEGNGFGPNTTFHRRTEEPWVATARAKVGFAINRWWGYVTGGVAWSRWEETVTNTNAAVAIPVMTDSETLTGWVIGAGMDYAFTNNWIFNAEFLYMDYGWNDYFTDVTLCTGCIPLDLEHTNFLLKVGLKYKFGGLF